MQKEINKEHKEFK